MNTDEKPSMPKAQVVYGEIVYWITIIACIICMIGPVISVASPENNVMNPYKLFNAIFEGKSPQTIWQEVGGGFPGGHFYLKNFSYGDGFTQFGLALGCSVAIWALIAAAIAYAREKIYFYVILALWVALLVFFSMTGLISGGH
ncbi:hypothetical protein ACFL9T_04120 [Thermodesulfobacteriota bacterium]